ncbi:RidA family protein [Chryseobacterium potabilaquae]|uniref:Reactive intermediate deaminase TdcF n=1 Tax=Chryseobacterium potabilaquae TaxID=2675057 RepID=A0A6N4X9W9_9FLAO|nr:RidA family protein [Chryseobacterium potabilaquae]CAA7196349.1 Putative reactive intermediate deaminase TdcF [Chryseobacterium potabilaquae]
MKHKILTEKAPQPSGNYSQAIQVENLVFISGQLPIKDNILLLDDHHNACRQCLENISNICIAAGGTINDIVKLNVYYTDVNYSIALDEVITEFFEAPFPARIRLGVTVISKGAKIEIDAIMCKKK